MILVDVFVPSVDVTYDFQLNEAIPVGTVIEEIAEMVGQKEQCRIVGDVGNLQICDKKSGLALDKRRTLLDCEIQTGDRLILI